MIIRMLKLALLFVVATVCHWALVSVFSSWGLNVNILLVFVTAFCAFSAPKLGYPAAFLGGLFLDFFSTKLFGYNAFSFTLAACVVYSAVGRLDFGSFIPQMFMSFLLTVLVGITGSSLVVLFTAGTIWTGWWSTLAGAFIGALCAPVIFMVVRWALGNEEKSLNGR